MKPFSLLVSERMKDPERAVRETMSRLERWRFKSGTLQVSLDDVAWLAAVFAVAGIEAGKAMPGETPSITQSNEIKSANGSRVVMSVATDNNPMSDMVGG